MRRALLVIFLLLTATACQLAKADPTAEATARTFYDELRSGDNESLLSHLPPQMRNAPALGQILRLRGGIPPGAPTRSKVVSTDIDTDPVRGMAETIAIQYDYPGRVALMQVTLIQPPGARDWQVAGVQVHGATDAELARYDFTLGGKSPAQLAFLAYAVIAPLLMLFAVVKVAATPGLRHKWVWVVLSCIGVCNLQMNWANGLLFVNWYAVQVVGAGFVRGASRFDPWTVSATLPLGALLILGGLVATPSWARQPAGGASRRGAPKQG